MWTSENPEFSNKKMTAEFFKDAVSKFSENALLEQDAINLDKHDPEFATLMTNYRDGIFIFKLQEDEIWNKVKVDSLKLKDYFLSTKDNYKWPDRVNYAEIFSRNDSLIHHYYDLLKEGVSFDSLASKYNEKYELKDRAGEVGLQDVDSSEVASDAYKLEKPGDYSTPIKTTDGYYIIRLIEKSPAHPKSFEEAKPEISGAYQEAESKILEKNYLDNLSKIYKPKLYYDELDQAFKSN
jgi:peptidyl-prolyl cis-trans isomerase SurA